LPFCTRPEGKQHGSIRFTKGTAAKPAVAVRALPNPAIFSVPEHLFTREFNSDYGSPGSSQESSEPAWQHLNEGWGGPPEGLKQHFSSIPVPRQMPVPSDENGIKGHSRCDLLRNLNLSSRQAPDSRCGIFSRADQHFNRMKIPQMLEYPHVQNAPLPGLPCSPGDGSSTYFYFSKFLFPSRARRCTVEFELIETSAGGAIVRFHEKNPECAVHAGDPNALLLRPMGD